MKPVRPVRPDRNPAFLRRCRCVGVGTRLQSGCGAASFARGHGDRMRVTAPINGRVLIDDGPVDNLAVLIDGKTIVGALSRDDPRGTGRRCARIYASVQCHAAAAIARTGHGGSRAGRCRQPVWCYRRRPSRTCRHRRELPCRPGLARRRFSRHRNLGRRHSQRELGMLRSSQRILGRKRDEMALLTRSAHQTGSGIAGK